MSTTEVCRLQQDVAFLAKRCVNAGSFSCGEEELRDYGASSNSIVAMAYGVGTEQEMPFDWYDYAACVRAVRKMPRHRRTPQILNALAKAKASISKRGRRRKAA